eukprot:scaffold52808_cov49-Cyclotella_meneghiniana.AAC.8
MTDLTEWPERRAQDFCVAHWARFSAARSATTQLAEPWPILYPIPLKHHTRLQINPSLMPISSSALSRVRVIPNTPRPRCITVPLH